MTPIRVLYVSWSLTGGGAERVTSLLINELDGDFEQHVALLSDVDITYQVPSDVRIIACKDGKRSAFLASVAREVRPDVVVCVGDYSYLLLSGVILRFPTVVSLRNAPRSYSETGLKPVIWEALRRLSYRKAARVVFQTDYAERFYRRYSVGRSAVIPNPIKDDLPRSSGKRDKRVVNFCRLDPQKNIPLLIEAFGVFHETHPWYRLDVYGRGELEGELSRLISQSGLDACAAIRPFSQNIHDVVKDAGMFVSSSDFEGISNSMLEAMAIGVPTISTRSDGGGAEQTISDGVNGLLVPKGDVAALASAMGRVADSDALANRISEGGMRLRQELAPSAVAAQWKTQILLALDRSAAPGRSLR